MKRLLPFFLVLLAVSGPVSGLEWQAVDAEIAFTWQYNAQLPPDSIYPGNNKYPSILMFNLGASFFADWDGEPGGLYFRPGGWFSWNTEDVYNGIARHSEEAEIGHMKVLGLMADAPFGYVFKAGNIDIGVQGGPSLYFRFPLWTAQEGTAVPADFWKAYYGAAQFLYFGIASWAVVPVSETLDFLPGLRFYYPVSNLWTAAPGAHNIQVALTASLRFDAFSGTEKKQP